MSAAINCLASNAIGKGGAVFASGRVKRVKERMISSPKSHALADRVPTYQEKRKDVQKSK
jgi:hypothetical protein